jgi:hypothetical protein
VRFVDRITAKLPRNINVRDGNVALSTEHLQIVIIIIIIIIIIIASRRVSRTSQVHIVHIQLNRDIETSVKGHNVNE